MYFDFEDFKDGFISFTEFCGNKIIYPILLVLSGICSYYTWLSIQALPKPETIPELIGYLFNNHEGYFKAFWLTLLVSILIGLLSFGTMGFGIRFDELHKALRIMFVILGIGIFISGVYFFGYFLLLLLVLVIVGAFAIAIFSDSGSSGKRSRRY
ncbi:MAG: hypothetical protein ACOYVK_20895 [Bacillota bacterium]